MNHPERRAGQRWKMTNLVRPFTGLTVEGTLVDLSPEGYWNLRDVVRSEGDPENSCLWESNFTDGKHQCVLLSDAPAAGPDRSGCKAWCGMECMAIYAVGGALERDYMVARDFAHGVLRWCSPDCCDARVPPLPVTPEAKPMTADTAAHNRAAIVVTPFKSAPPAQEPPKAPVCVRAGKHPCLGPVLKRVIGHAEDAPVAAFYCENAMLAWEVRARDNTVHTGAPYAGPERLPRPKMAHVGHAGGDVTL